MASVFLIDDHPDLLQIMRELLEMCGHVVQCYSSVDQAMAALANHRPDALIVDMYMPGTSGLAMVSQIRADPSLASLYVVLYSGEDGLRDAALSAGAQDYWIKGSDLAFEQVSHLDANIQSLLSESNRPVGS